MKKSAAVCGILFAGMTKLLLCVPIGIYFGIMHGIKTTAKTAADGADCLLFPLQKAEKYIEGKSK